MKCLIVDDEIAACENLNSLLGSYAPQWSVLPFAHNTKQAEIAILNAEPDIVFLDIGMPNETGISLMERLPNRSFSLIFVTAYSEFALKAFRLNAIDYLLKPIDIEDLKQLCNKISSQEKYQTHSLQYQVIKDLSEQRAPSTLVIPYNNGQHLVQIEQISYIEADGNYCKFMMKNAKSFFVTKQLGFFVNNLPNNRFFRIHNSYLVDITEIEKIVTQPVQCVVLKNQEKLPLARRRKDELLEKLNSLK